MKPLASALTGQVIKARWFLPAEKTEGAFGLWCQNYCQTFKAKACEGRNVSKPSFPFRGTGGK